MTEVLVLDASLDTIEDTKDAEDVVESGTVELLKLSMALVTLFIGMLEGAT